MGKHAVVVGVNYLGSSAQLKGCLNDAKTITSILVDNGYNVATLSDAHPHWYPAEREVILLSLDQLVRDRRPGDHVLFYFSGHGTQVPSATPGEEDGLDEAIVTSDWQLITDDQLRWYFARLPSLVRATAIMDCCHSGTLFDGTHRIIFGDKLNDLHHSPVPKTSFSGQRVDRFIPYSVVKDNVQVCSASLKSTQQLLPPLSTKAVPVARSVTTVSRDVCVLMSACQANEECKDVQPEYGPAFGAFTKALEIAYKTNSTAKFHDLVMDVRKLLLRAGFSQNPCLECAPVLAHVPFLS